MIVTLPSVADPFKWLRRQLIPLFDPARRTNQLLNFTSYVYLITNSLGSLLTYHVLAHPTERNNEIVVTQPYYTHTQPRNNLIVARKGLQGHKK